MEQEDRDGGEDTALAHGSGHDEDDDTVQDGFGDQYGNVPGQAVLNGSDNSHSADTDGEGGGDKGVHEFVVAAVAALLPQKRPEGLGVVLQVDGLAHQGTQRQGHDHHHDPLGLQLAILDREHLAAHAAQAQQDDAQSHGAHEGLLEPFL